MSDEDLQRLLALLQVDKEGEQIAEKLNQILVDRRKRTLLLVKLQEIEQTVGALGQEVSLTPSEAEVVRLIQDARRPLSAQEVTERASGRLESLKYRQHASATLNSLVDKGVLGKLRGPRRLQYFTEALEAIKQTINQLGQSPEEYDAQAVAESTGLSTARVLELAQEI